MNYKALYLSPMIPSSDARATASFLRDVFGFTIGRDDGRYVILHKDHLTLHIKETEIHPDDMELYLEVDRLDELWNSIKEKVGGMRVREPFDREYGMREFHIALPHTNTIMFVGQETKR